LIPYPRTWAEIDLGAFRRNLAAVRSLIPAGTSFGLVAKADAYGHGIIPVSREATANGVDWLCVATVQEGIAVREAEIDAPVLALAPALDVEAAQVVFYGLRAQIESLDNAKALSAAATKQEKPAKVHLKIDTGMSRFGTQPEDAVELAVGVSKLPGVEIEGVATHFSSAANDPEYTEWQFRRYVDTLERLASIGVVPTVRHCGNSAALVNRPDAAFDMVRVGLLAYGISHVAQAGISLVPALTWKTRIMAMRALPERRKIGYNGTFESSRAMTVATLGVGYGDGYHRGLSNQGFVFIHGKRAPICGLVCMDQIMVDVTEISGVQIGDEAELLGSNVRAEDLAAMVGTTPHEMPTRIMSRVPRWYRRD
jgi:alanine racemase